MTFARPSSRRARPTTASTARARRRRSRTRRSQKELKEAATSLKSAADSLRGSPSARSAGKGKSAARSASSAPVWRSASARACATRSSTRCSAPRRSSSTPRPPRRTPDPRPAARRRSGPRLSPTSGSCERRPPGRLSRFRVRCGIAAAAWRQPRTAPRKLDGEKAGRIVAAMRESVGARGAAGSTFDVVAREAGVSRGLLHYYFGSKERLMVEVVRRDCDARVAELEDAAWSRPPRSTRSSRRWSRTLDAFVQGEPGTQAVIYEMLSASHHSEEIRAEMAELYRTWRQPPGRRAAPQGAGGRGHAGRRPRVGGLADLRHRRRPRPAADLRSRVGSARPSLDVATDTARHLLGAA